MNYEITEVQKSKELVDRLGSIDAAIKACDIFIADFMGYRLKPYLTVVQAKEAAAYWEEVKEYLNKARSLEKSILFMDRYGTKDKLSEVKPWTQEEYAKALANYVALTRKPDGYYLEKATALSGKETYAVVFLKNGVVSYRNGYRDSYAAAEAERAAVEKEWKDRKVVKTEII